MHSNRILSSALIALAISTVGIAGAGVGAAAADPGYCKPTMILGIAGTSEGPQHGGDPYGKAVRHAVDAAVAAGGGSAAVYAEPLDYPANLFPYTPSKNQGYRAAYRELASWARNCRATRPMFVLIGFSQGAHIAGDLSATILRGQAPALAGRLKSTLLLADSVLNPLDPKVTWINPQNYSGGIAGLRQPWLSTDPVYSVCIANDLVCDPGLDGRLGYEVHTKSYADEAYSWLPPSGFRTPSPGETIAAYFGALLLPPNYGNVLPPEIVSRALDGTRLSSSYFAGFSTDVLTTDGRELGFWALDPRLGAAGYSQGVLRDLPTGSMDVVTQSRAYLEPPPDAPPGVAPPSGIVHAVSGSGRFVAFCGAPYWYYPDDLVHCHLLDRQTGSLDLIDRDSEGNPGGGTGADANQAVQSISENGRYVLFNSQSSALLPPGAPPAFHPYRLDRETGIVDIVGRTLNGDVAAGAQGLQMTPDGRYITFVSPDGNVVAGDANGKHDVFRRDMVTNETVLISTGLDRAFDPGTFGAGVMSADGTKVLFQTSGDGSQNGIQVYLRDTDAGMTTLVSIAEAGSPLTGFSLYPSMSDDGKRIAFCWSEFSPTCADGQVYVRDLEEGWSERAFTSTAYSQDFAANRPHISGDGKVVVFASNAPLTTDDDGLGFSDIFRVYVP